MRPPLNNETDESEVTEVSSQTAASQEPIATATTFTSTLSVKINQLENKKENKEKKEYEKFLKGFTETRIKKYSEPFVRQPSTNKVTDLESKKEEEEEFTSFSKSFTESRLRKFSEPISRKLSDKKNLEKKDEEQVSSLKQENIETHELLEEMLIKLKTEPTDAVSYKDKVKIKNILCEIQNINSKKVIEDIKNIINNNKQTITKKTLSYLNENLGKFMVNKTSKVDDEVLVQGADDGVVDQ